jgi:TIR domain
MIPQELFLSHSSVDKIFVDHLTEVLGKHGVNFWYSPVNIVGAQQWHDEIGAALQRCDSFLIVLSPAAVQSLWVKRELCYALEQRRYNNRITPVLFQNCDYEQLSWTLSALQLVNFTEGFDEGCQKLLRIWNINYLRS